MSHQSILNAIQDQYGSVARSDLSNESEAVRVVAKAFGYSPEELASLPPQANMGLSCGNPVAVAGLREGEVVVDLGSGGGLDVFLAAQRVGPTGKAIGVDMTPDMIDRACSQAGFRITINPKQRGDKNENDSGIRQTDVLFDWRLWSAGRSRAAAIRG